MPRGEGAGRGVAEPAALPGSRSVLTLVYDSPYERSDVIASSLHRALIQRRYDSMTVTYHDHAQALDILRGGRRYDACILQPRTSTIRGSVLAMLRDLSDSVVIEGQMADGLDVDAISNDPASCVELAREDGFEVSHRSRERIRDAVHRAGEPVAHVVVDAPRPRLELEILAQVNN